MPKKGYKQTESHRWSGRRSSKSIIDRFQEKIFYSPDGCWYWLGSIAGRGYGHAWNGKKSEYAHRFSHRLFKGAIPENLKVCHSCDNTLCVNPDHLFLGTQLDNIRDMYKKGRNKPMPGHKLNRITVFLIRELSRMGCSQRKIGNYFGTCFQNISLIVNRKTHAKF